MGVLRYRLTDDSFLERRRGLADLADAPFGLVCELLPEVLHCLASDDEEGTEAARGLLRGHLSAKASGVAAAQAIATRGLAANELVAVLEGVLSAVKNAEHRRALADALHRAGAPIEKFAGVMIDAAAAGHEAAQRTLGVLRHEPARKALEKGKAKAALARLDGTPSRVHWEIPELVLGSLRPLITRLGLQTAIAHGLPGGSLEEWESEMNGEEEVVCLTTAPIGAFASADQFWIAAALGDATGSAVPSAFAVIDRLDLVPLRQSDAEEQLDDLLSTPDDPATLPIRGKFVGATRLFAGANEDEILVQTSEQYVRVFWYTTA